MSVASTLDANKYKLLMKISIEDLDVIKGTYKLHEFDSFDFIEMVFFFISFFAAKDENVRKIMREIENLTEDCTKLQQMLDITLSLRLVSWSFQTFSLSIYSIQFDLLFIFLISCEKYGASHQMPTSKYRGKCSRATKRFATTISWSTIKWLTAVCFGIGRKSIVSGIFVNYRWNFAICSFCVFFFFYFML